MSKFKQICWLVAIEIIVLLSIAPFLGAWQAIKFGLSFFALYFLPFVFFVAMIKELSLLEKFMLANILGLGTVPMIYFVAGLFRVRLNAFSFLLVPAIILAIGILIYARSPRKPLAHHLPQEV